MTELHCWQEGVLLQGCSVAACKRGWHQVLEAWAAGAGSQHVPLPENLSILLLPINPGSDEEMSRKNSF